MTTDRPPLTARQSRILDVIRGTVRDRGYPPTLRELTAAVGISSSSTASEQLRILEARGYIMVTPNTPRGIMVLDPATAQDRQAAWEVYRDSRDLDDAWASQEAFEAGWLAHQLRGGH